MSATNDLTGQRFGRLLVVGRAPSNHRGLAMWRCRCDCGGEKIAQGPNLRHGFTTSCGCVHRESVLALNATKVTHGRTRTAEYNVWGGIIDRCTNPNNKDWEHYGGRGITVCDRWRSFENFLIDMGERPDATLSIDRVDNDGPYSKENCRWATKSQQRRNSRQPLSIR